MPFKVDEISNGYHVFSEDNTLILEIQTYKDESLLADTRVRLYSQRVYHSEYWVHHQVLNDMGVELFAKRLVQSVRSNAIDARSRAAALIDSITRVLHNSYAVQDDDHHYLPISKRILR